jgi:hypothetical protein
MSQNKMFGKVTAILAGMMTLFGMKAESEIPINATEKKLDLSAEQITKLKAHFGEDYAAKMLEAVDGEIKAHLDGDMSLKAIQDELDAIIKEKDLNAKDLNAAKENKQDEGTIAAKIELLNGSLTAERRKREELEAQVQLLMEQPEGY